MNSFEFSGREKENILGGFPEDVEEWVMQNIYEFGYTGRISHMDTDDIFFIAIEGVGEVATIEVEYDSGSGRAVECECYVLNYPMNVEEYIA
jgi:hypothetical protein